MNEMQLAKHARHIHDVGSFRKLTRLVPQLGTKYFVLMCYVSKHVSANTCNQTLGHGKLLK